jgi:hypothetical protein
MARVGLLLAAALAALVGCHPHDLAPPVRTVAPQLALTTRGVIDPDVSALAAGPAAIPPRPLQYRRLTVAECRALAIKNAPLADDLDNHPANDSLLPQLFHKHADLANLSRLVRGYSADEIRNRSAADALEDYYKLAAAEGQFDLTLEAHTVLDKQHSAAQKAINEGLKDRGDVNAIRRQMLEIDGQTAKLEAGVVALNASLAARLNLDLADPAPLWPAEALRVSDNVIEVEQAVAAAMLYRPDLNLLRTLASDEHSTALTNAVLSGVNPLLGSANPFSALLAMMKLEPARAESKTRQQLQGLLSSRERQAEAEVRAAVATLRGARGAAAAKAAEVRNLSARVAELEKRDSAGQQVTAELTTARIDLLKARGELVQAVADWHIADVKLRQAMGLLVRE